MLKAIKNGYLHNLDGIHKAELSVEVHEEEGQWICRLYSGLPGDELHCFDEITVPVRSPARGPVFRDKLSNEKKIKRVLRTGQHEIEIKLEDKQRGLMTHWSNSQILSVST